MNSWLFLSLILAHVIGDFYLQNHTCPVNSGRFK